MHSRSRYVESFPNNTHSLSLVSSNVHFLPDTPYSSITTYICDACQSYPSSSKTRHCRHTQALQRTLDAQTNRMHKESNTPNVVSDNTILNPKDCQPNVFIGATLHRTDGVDVHCALPIPAPRALPVTPLRAKRPFLKI
ncbi:hypothetical protein DPMN_152745 [Dreissena polymorpha]|uniref:Uncharacterized protein n=1 Tax=Dreissena polymorpha TaxID=45954 RepID=A0A9D4FNI5_DREPO|nr:hypothetical protein DPMN_152715 [Dreissena polymorpha]KAH3799141.1 hypothetical protein DPMN_152745 [Dreissena polymorpha]